MYHDHEYTSYPIRYPIGYTQNKNLVEVGQLGIKNGSWLVNLVVTLGY